MKYFRLSPRLARNITAALLGGVLFLGLSASTHALTIAYFDNDTYGDTDQETVQLGDDLIGLGHTLNSFSGITAADWMSATSSADLLIIPELDHANLFPDLSLAARTAISDYVTGGGGLIMIDRNGRTGEMLNGLFGYALVGGGVGDTNITLDAVGTPFAGGPAALPDANAVEGYTIASLPVGVLNLYDDGVDSSVFVKDQGAGRVGYLAFDWFEDPAPSPWVEVLGTMVDYVGAPTSVPEPTTLLLLGLGLAGLGFARRRVH